VVYRNIFTVVQLDLASIRTSSSINISLILILCRAKFDISVPFLSRLNHKELAMTGNIDEYFHGLEVIKLIAAIVKNQHEELEKLLQTDVNINEKNALGATPLSWAACVGNLPCISKLLDLGADIGATNLKGETALHFAAQCGQAEAVLLLLDRGADVQAADSREKTVLHAAVEDGEDNYEVVSLLIERGADVFATDVNGRTALQCTQGLKQQNIATLLKLQRPLLSPSPMHGA
jgi:hypothetical protein